MSKQILDITPSTRLLQVLGDIPLQPWQCLAELADNSLDELLKQPERGDDNPLVVKISIEESGGSTFLVVNDNGKGMDAEELERSMRAGYSTKNRYGSLGIFGMGFNIATARLGNVTTVNTTKAGMSELLQATIDFADLQKRESFTIPLQSSPVAIEQEGTTVNVLLKREMAELFKRPAMQKTLIAQLGDVYSFLLRDSVPGISKSFHGSRIPARITFNNEPVEPKLPCVWSDARTVTSYGQQVSAIQYIDTRLTPATACLDCGHWDKKSGPMECEECGSKHLEVRDRRIWGWLGIQRYIDSTNFGIDFIRYGRKILKGDKTVFNYTDPDTLQTDAEYPIEMPANQGRIVGEIHLDHVPVTYQKNDFDRQSRDWQIGLQTIRGNGPLKPRGAREVNDSPLAKLYSAYRRNDPGLRYLTPGDGKTALHTKAREWATYFEKGVARFTTDEEWYEAAARHQRIKDGETNGSSPPPKGEKPGGESPIKQLIGDPKPDEPSKKKEHALTQQQMLEHARLLGTRREDLCNTYKLNKALGNWNVVVIATREVLVDNHGQQVPTQHGFVKGTEIEILVASEHPIFRDYGRDIRDVALIHAASMIRELTSSDATVASVYAELVQETPDLKISTPLLLERIEITLDRIRKSCLPVISSDSNTFWNMLQSNEKQFVEEAGALKLPTTSFQELVSDGRFILFCPANTLANIINDRSMAFFDGVVFKPSLFHRSPGARDRIVGKVTRALMSLADFVQDDLLRQKYDLQLVQMSLDLLDEQLAGEDLIA